MFMVVNEEGQPALNETGGAELFATDHVGWLAARLTRRLLSYGPRSWYIVYVD